MRRRFQKRARVQLHQAAIATLARGQQNNSGRRRIQSVAGVGILIAEVDRQFATNDRLDAIAGELVREFQRAEHVVGVGQRQCRLLVRLRQFGELLDLDRPFQQRISTVNMKMDESDIGHCELSDRARRV